MACLPHFVQIRLGKGRSSHSRLRQFLKTGVPKAIPISNLLNEHLPASDLLPGHERNPDIET